MIININKLWASTIFFHSTWDYNMNDHQYKQVVSQHTAHFSSIRHGIIIWMIININKLWDSTLFVHSTWASTPFVHSTWDYNMNDHQYKQVGSQHTFVHSTWDYNMNDHQYKQVVSQHIFRPFDMGLYYDHQYKQGTFRPFGMGL